MNRDVIKQIGAGVLAGSVLSVCAVGLTRKPEPKTNVRYTFGYRSEDGNPLFDTLLKEEVSNVFLDQNGFPVIFNTSKVNENTNEVTNLLTGRTVDLDNCRKQNSFFDYLKSGNIIASSQDEDDYYFEAGSILVDLSDLFDYTITTEKTVNNDGSITITETMKGPLNLTKPVDGPLYDENGNIIGYFTDDIKAIK